MDPGLRHRFSPREKYRAVRLAGVLDDDEIVRGAT